MHRGAEAITGLDFNERPFIVIWEATQACDLACVHCRASAQPLRSKFELSTTEAQGLIDQIAEMRVPVFVITGGDPLKRPDIYQLVEYATSRGVRTSLTPSATPLLTEEAIAELQRRGLARRAVSLDGSTAEIHDAFRRVPSSYDCTLKAIGWARECGLPVQINTTVTRRNLADFEQLAGLLKTLEIVLWSVFFLVPTGRGQLRDLISAEEFEEVFAKLYDLVPRVPFDMTTEAQHFRRYRLQRRTEKSRRRRPVQEQDPGAIPFVFISQLGEVFPSGFLPIAVGNVRRVPLQEIYQHAPLFVSMRDTSRLRGKCGVCEFRNVCGGSRARAFALTGDPFAEEPCCVYEPKTAALCSQ
jgi:radical SAM protein with 4Fe4S-binding SPASM domain